MPLRNAGVIEIVGWVVRHAQFFHDPSGADVRQRGERNDFAESDLLESKRQRRAGALSPMPLVPKLEGQAPASLNAGCEMRLEPWNREADKSRKWGDIRDLDSPPPKTVP